MRNLKVVKLEQAINTLEYAKYQILEALGDSDSAQSSINDIDSLIVDLDANIVFLQDGVRRG